MSDINNLGSFSSIDAVWARYPEGGKEGDYCTVGGKKYRWNKYDCIWENAEVVTQSTARQVETFNGDVHVHNDLVVGGVLRAKNVKQPNCGLFDTVAALKAAYPTPEVGMWATVGNTVPAAVYRCDVAGTWRATGETGGIDSLDWNRISNIEGNVSTLQSENNSRKSEIQTLNTENNSRKAAIEALQTQLNTLLEGNVDETIDSFNEVVSFLAGVKDEETLTALLQTLNDRITSSEKTCNHTLRFVPFWGFVNNVKIEMSGVTSWNAVVYDSGRNAFLVVKNEAAGMDGGAKFYNAWSGQGEYYTMEEDDEVCVIREDRIFIDILTGDAYRGIAGGGAITAIGVTHAELEELAGRISALEELAADELDEVIPVKFWTASSEGPLQQMQMLYVGEYKYDTRLKKLYVGKERRTPQGLIMIDEVEVTPSAKKLYLDITNCLPYIWKGGDMVAIAPKDTPASIFNATTAVPIQGYYVLCDSENEGLSAVHAAWKEEKAVSGLIISFEMSAGIWKTYQYVGKTVTQTNWLDPDNWKDFGSLAAGSETYLVIDELCGTPTGGAYTLGSAVDALIAYQTKTGVSYAKKGLIISYKTGQNEMETKQFQGEVSDFKEVGLWKDFGGGGKVEAKDDVEKDGKDALSTGGAYNLIPANLKVDTETEGVVKVSMVNAEGEQVGDEQQFPVGTGGGGSFSGTIVSAAFKQSPMYGNAGSEFIVEAAIRSVSTSGTEEQLNNIEKAELYDRDSNTLLDTFVVNKASSATLSDFDFKFDLSSYMQQAGTRRFRMVFTDDGGNTGSRNLNMTAVDVTISSVQTLQYTQATALEVNGASKSIPLFKFANNANQINAITEIYLDGSWQKLNEQVVKDTYSVALTLNPNNILGRALAHGVYALRIHGEDVTSGVVGNYLHTSLFVIGTAGTPLVATRWISAEETAKVKLYESIKIEYAVYDPNTTSALAQVFLGDELVASHVAYRSSFYSYDHQVTGVAFDGSEELQVKVMSASASSPVATFRVEGTVIDALLKTGAIYAFDFSNRSNEDSNKDIESNGYKINVHGSNYSTTGFMTFNGKKCLRIAEDVTAEITHTPFASTAIERTGMGLQFSFAAKNLPDDNATLMSCYDEESGAGFYVTGRAIGIYCANSTTNKREERFYKQGKETTVMVVAEPAVDGLGVNRAGTDYYFLKLYLDGEQVACVGYTAGNSNLIQPNNIKIDGTKGEFYLFYALAWDDYFQFDQAFQNYLVKLTDTDDMVKEYTFENVMAAQQISEYGGTTIKSRPQAAEMYARGMAYFVECPYNGSNIESLDNTTSTDQNMYVTLYYFNPARPWQNFVAYDVRRRNQGTTSAKRPVKNPRYYLAAKNGSTYNKSTKTGGTYMVLLNPDETTEAGRRAIQLAKCNKMQLFDDSIPIDTITVKLDYSDSSNANDCGVCDQMNATFQALGGMYITPAQRAFDGTWEGKYTENGQTVKVKLTGLKMNHSTANHPAAMFRSTESTGVNPYFHAKGNWKEDKKEQVALGFKDVPGYNKGCLNYGDFVEYYGRKGETLTEAKARFLQDATIKTDSVYIITEYCGRSYKVMRYVEDSWKESEGSMKQVNGKWVIEGDVMNPTDGFELLQYQGMDWFKGVATVEDMMAPTATFSKWVQSLIDKGSISIETAPAWTNYFECLLDDDNLAIAYAEGKKVPYNLFEWMRFCNDCDPDGSDRAAALKKWHDELYKYASPHSCFAYDVFSDYDAATDQRAKNMQPMWFLEEGASVVNGVYFDSVTIGCKPMRMYLNKIYDCDTCNGKDNDGGQTVDAETDPNRMTDATFTNPYAGYGSILFRNMFLQQSVITAEGETTELNLQSVASAMRSCTATVGGVTLRPFSPEGAEYFFLTQRIRRWQKKVSSYDGERKYIQFTGTSDAIYFYALQGLGLTSLPAFIERRWRYRDGFFGVGDFFSGVLSGRVNAPSGARIHIRAAKSGYFGIGNDSSGSITEKVYLEAGDEHYFTNFSHEEGALLYIYQADRMSMLDLSEITLSNTFDFSIMSLVEELRIGGYGYHALTIGSYQLLTTISLGELAFLKSLHVQNTGITTIGCEGCPRLESIYAFGSQLQRVNLADGAKIKTLQLPATYNYLRLRYLPELTIDGIQLESTANVSTLIIENCTKIDSWELLMRFARTDGTKLKVVRATPINRKGDGTELDILSSLNMQGLDATLTLQEKPAIVGKYRCTTYKRVSDVQAWQSAFGADLKVYNALYSQYTMSDLESDPKNMTNEDNKTGYKYGTAYEPSGYIKSIRKYCVPVQASPNSDGTAVQMQLLLKSDNTKYADGSDYDVADTIGAGYDTFARFPHFWYKGVNDVKTQEKHILLNYGTDVPEPSWEQKKEGMLSELVYKRGMAVSLGVISDGFPFSDEMLVAVASTNVYRIDVEGMKLVRYYGMNNAQYGGLFVDANGNALQKALLALTGTTNSPLDFVDGDYIFREVPAGAKYFYFTCLNTVDQSSVVFAVDSDDIEAVEPEWVEHKAELIGVYGLSIDDLKRGRSLSGKKTRTGTGTQTTSNEWAYDREGNPTNAPVGNMNYTYQDLLNVCRSRGRSYHSISYEQSKILAILSLCWCGNRDDQSVYGMGTSSQYTTGDKNRVGMDTKYGQHSGTNKVWNVEGAIACNWEIMDFIGVNISTFKEWKANFRSQVGPVNGIAHIYDPRTDTERTVPYCTTSGYNIARLVMGKYCDVLASKTNSDNSKWVTAFCAGTWYTASAGRCVGRASSSAVASGGLVCANANNASSSSYALFGARLAFSGVLSNDAEIDKQIDEHGEEYDEE